jgi:hypothetical protein
MKDSPGRYAHSYGAGLRSRDYARGLPDQAVDSGLSRPLPYNPQASRPGLTRVSLLAKET